MSCSTFFEFTSISVYLFICLSGLLTDWLIVYNPMTSTTAGSSSLDFEVLTNATKTRLQKEILTSSFCNKVVQNVIASNVTILHTAEQIVEIYAICGLKSSSPVTYQAKVIPRKEYPTSQPTSQPTTIPLPPPTSRQHLVTVHFIGYLFIILVLACLRCAPVIIACCTKDLLPKRSHLYDILVILNDTEEAVFQNVRHEDIVFSRRYNTPYNMKSSILMSMYMCTMLSSSFFNCL